MQKLKKELAKKFTQVKHIKINFDALSRDDVLHYISALKKIGVLLKYLQTYAGKTEVNLLRHSNVGGSFTIKNSSLYKSIRTYVFLSNLHAKTFYKVLKYVKKYVEAYSQALKRENWWIHYLRIIREFYI